ncbi:cytochrome P450 [Ramlibacter henchirensis]|uniref:Cytochrome P450 n=1 Tax=Ramlibacter henchirensis TaxID=204072 RepID=A0A4Z0BU58_9BURK|nr:cytochrome P450 [Ramlibacter henchirensis]TFZ02833.1 cytochrome P450 [Ramlibacter henchirensis]
METVIDKIPHVDVDPWTPELIDEPYEMHELVREAGPVAYIPKYDLFVVGRHAEVQAVLTNWETFISSAGVGLANFRHEAPFRPKSILLEADPPDHTVVRTVISRIMSPKNLQQLRDLFEAEAITMVDRVLEKRQVDGVKDIAEYFPLKVFPDAVGLETEGRDNLLLYGDMVFNALGPRNELFERSMEKLKPVSSWIMDHCTREALRPGGLGHLIYEAADKGEINQDQAAMLVRSFLSAGVDTTIGGIANILLTLARHPAEYAKLHANPALARQTFEEGLRYESIVQTIFRTTGKPAEIAGVSIDEDRKVLTLLGSANRDPRKWSEPNRFNVERNPVGHVTFGAGIHGCVGQMIARMEGEIVLRALAKKVKRIELTGRHKRHHNNSLRAMHSLPLELVPA